MLLEILTYPNPTLRKLSQPVKKVTEELVQFTKDMLETMYSSHGVGLAAPQVGRLERVVVIDTRPKGDNEETLLDEMTDLEKKISYPLILINPEITLREDKTTYGEGCLSVPGFIEIVERANYIEVDALDAEGKKITLKTDGLLAICIQHEIDHLDGKLFIDRLSFLKSNKIKNRIKKYGYEHLEAAEDGADKDSKNL